jgi:hypothetical protein
MRHAEIKAVVLNGTGLLYTMSCKEEFDEKVINCVRSFPVIHDLCKKSYKDKIAKDNAWKSIAAALEREGKFSV